jgi:hypothetical protein
MFKKNFNFTRKLFSSVEARRKISEVANLFSPLIGIHLVPNEKQAFVKSRFILKKNKK